MGEPPDRLLISSPSTSAVETVRRVKTIQAQYWHCMYPKPPRHPAWSGRLHGRFRWSSSEARLILSQMLFVRSKRKSFTTASNLRRFTFTAPQFQSHLRTWCWPGKGRSKKINMRQMLTVIASPNYTQNVPLVLIFHDPYALFDT